jgi:hypothetical protein
MATITQIQKPVAIIVGLNISYTVPSGKIAKVKALLSALARANSFSGNPGSGGYSNQPSIGDGQAVSETLEFILVSGDVLSSVRTAASASATATSNQPPAVAIGTTTVTLTINGANAAQINAAATAACSTSTSGSGSTSVSVTGVAAVGFIAEEYFE